MGLNVFELFAKIGLDTSGFDKGLNNVGSKMSGFGSTISGFGSKISGIGKMLGGIGSTIAKIGGIAMTTGTAAMTAFGKSAISAGMDFDSSMAQVAATMGKTVDEISELREFAQEMGRTTAFSATQAADALNYMALAGYDAKTSMEMLPSVLNLAAAGGMDLALASDMITDSQSALGLSLEDTSELVDKMAQAASKSNTSVAQLGDAILTVGGTAKNLRGGTTELTTILGMLADNGIKGAEGGTALRNILNSLTAPTSEAAKLLAKMGVEVYDSTGNMRSLNDVFLDMRDAMDSMSQQGRMNVISTIFNARDMKSAEAILANVGKRYEELSGYIDDAAGAAQDMADTQLDNLAGDITLFQSALEGAKITISDVLTPSLREFVQFGTDGISRLTEAFQNEGLDGAMTTFGDILSSGLQSGIAKAPEFLEAGFNLASALGNGLLDNLDIIIESGLQIGEMFGEAFISSIPRLIEAANTVILSLATAISENSESIKEAILTALNNAVSNISEFIPIIADVITDIITVLTSSEVLGELLKAGKTIVEAIGTAISDNASQLGQAALKIIVFLANQIIENSDNIISSATEILMTLINNLTAQLPMLIDLGLQVITKLAEGIGQALPTLIPAAVQAVITIAQTLIAPENISMLIDAAIQLITGLAEGIIEALPILIDAIPELIQALLTAILENLPKLVNMGIELTVQLGMGLIAAIPDLVAMIPEIIAAIALALIDGVPEMVKSGGELIDGLISAFTDNPILDSFEEWWTELKDWWGGVIDDVYNWGVDLMQTFEDGIESMLGSDWVEFWEDIGGDIYDYLHFSQPDKGPLSGPNGFKTFGPDMIKTFVEGVKSNEPLLQNELNGVMEGVQTAFNTPITPDISGAVPLGYGSMQTSANSEQPIVIQVDGETFAKFVYKYNNREAQRVGATLTEAVSV